jgi:hypothetical protein
VKRWRVLLVGILAVGTVALGRPAAAATDHLPDLGMAQLREFSIDTTTIPGHRLLRFTTVIVNVGDGPFETIGSRPATSTPEMTVVQRIYDDAGAHRDVAPRR